MTPARIFVVEDDFIVARDIREQLSRLGHSVVGVSARGEDAAQLVLDSAPDLVLMDIRLEGEMDGIEAAKQILAASKIPVVYLTAYADDLTLKRALITEPFGYILKPFDESQLRTAIEMAVYRHAAERKLRGLLESELLDARDSAAAANRVKDDFLANVSHEIRTPMNAILGMTELALGSAQTDHQRQLLSTVKSAAGNLLDIVNDLLDFSKMAAGEVVLDHADFSLRATLADTVSTLHAHAQRKGLRLVCQVAPETPDALFGDAGRLRQVLINLMGNALKFTAQGEVMADVRLAPSASTDDTICLLFTVLDTGVGIAREKQAAIFGAFEQEDSSTTRKYDGTGLGLTICSQLVALMGGEITVESELGQGSTFRFTARFALSSRPTPVGAASIAAPERTQGNVRELGGGAALNILVAEDNELNVDLLRELLTQRGHSAEFARDGRDALALSTAGSFDLLLLDLNMPEMDGFEVVQAIREREHTTGAHLPIIALTARSSTRDRERCLAAGMDDFLSKPIEAEALWAAVDRAIVAFPRARAKKSRLLDPGAISRACGGHDAILKKLCAVFQRSLPGHMTRVRSALNDNNLPRLAEAAHLLYGTLGAFSTIAGALALSLEDFAIRQEADCCPELVDRLESMCVTLLEETRDLTLAQLDPGRARRSQ
jgi:signal transduction histidine kinase